METSLPPLTKFVKHIEQGKNKIVQLLRVDKKKANQSGAHVIFKLRDIPPCELTEKCYRQQHGASSCAVCRCCIKAHASPFASICRGEHLQPSQGENHVYPGLM